MKHSTLGAGACVLVFGAILAATSSCLGTSVRGKPEATSGPVQAEAFPAGAFALAASLSARDIALLEAGGMEMSSAGLHLIFPSDAEDPDLINPALFPWPGEFTVRRWGFWACHPQYDIPYHACDHILGRSSIAVNVSFDAVVPTELFTFSILVDAPTGTLALLAYADSDSLAALRRLFAPLEFGNGYTTDWYGIKRPTGSPETALRVALVAEDTAYLPLNIGEAVFAFSQGMISDRVFILADRLSTAEAQRLLDRLN